LKVEAEAIEQPVTGTAELAASMSPRKANVLVAEDDPDMRRLVAAILRGAGHRVVEATDGMQILDRIESTIWSVRPHVFDVIVTDVHMPGLSGLDVLAALRCTRWTTPVILVTAFGDDETRSEARALGAIDVIDKPFNPDELRSAVSRALAPEDGAPEPPAIGDAAWKSS
jgi:CheY-like chemotaxis protein